jgi:hypothetical protein
MRETPKNLALRPSKRQGRRIESRSASEVTGQLTEWSALLIVSHQVRAITLRLCFVGSSLIAGSTGLHIDITSYLDFIKCVRRLGKHYQMTESDSVPTNDKTLALVKTYKQFPKIYPHLKQYATFRHGIRKVSMQMDFLNYFHFFRITAGGFKQYWKPYLDYEVFEMLPHLSELLVKLPDAMGLLQDHPRQTGPPLFYGHPFDCPRILHRLIYEQAAEVLARYGNVTMQGFIDELEDMRFKALRKTAIEGLKFNAHELEELYTEDDDGVELEESVIPGVKKEKTDDKEEDSRYPARIPNTFWPPKCRCEVLCRRVLHPA